MAQDSKAIDQQQDAIIAAFATLGNDRLAMLDYLIDIGTALPTMASCYKTENHLVQGCMSKVWLVDRESEGLLFFQADSNTAITKGLIALLLQVLSGQPGQAIAAAELYFMEAIGMHALIGFQRSSGLAHMIKTIKLKAVARLAQTAPCCHTC
ncbi:SufE family protein [Candidatus Cardinium hertigii]|nr:SufE family protein [Candidatus Cardinium hertigii]